MEPIFENVYTDTEEMFQEQSAYSGRVLRSIFVVLSAVASVGSIAELLLDLSCFHGLLALFWVGYTVYLLLLPRIRAKKHMKNELAEYGGVLPQTIVQFFENEVTAQCGRTTNTISYEQITDIIVLDHTIILHAKKVSGIPISPKHFTKGSVEEMYHFLRSKCPGVKLPGWRW